MFAIYFSKLLSTILKTISDLWFLEHLKHSFAHMFIACFFTKLFTLWVNSFIPQINTARVLGWVSFVFKLKTNIQSQLAGNVDKIREHSHICNVSCKNIAFTEQENIKLATAPAYEQFQANL